MRVAVVDLETTGLSFDDDHIIEVGVVHFDDGVVSSKYGSLVKTSLAIPKEVVALTGITNTMMRAKGAPWAEVGPSLVEELSGADIWCAHNSDFDFRFLDKAFSGLEIELDYKPIVDTLRVAQRFMPNSLVPSKKLSRLTAFFHVAHDTAHRSVDDAEAAGRVLYAMCERYGVSVAELSRFSPLALGQDHFGEDPFTALYSGLPKAFYEKKKKERYVSK